MSGQDFSLQLVEEFLRGFSVHAGANLHVEILYGRDAHHFAEAVFKGLAKAVGPGVPTRPARVRRAEHQGHAGVSSRFLDWFDRAWRWWTILTAIVLIAGAGFVAFVLAAQSRKDREFVRENLLPLAHGVETLRDAQGRLPTGAEFAEWAAKAAGQKRVEYYPQKPPFVSDWGTPGRDFIVGAWRGGWMHYYQSWNGKDFAGEMAPMSEMTAPRH